MSEKFTLYDDSKYENHATNELPLASKNMSKKEELAMEYSSNIPSEIYNTLETDADRLLWKSETERAFEAGWDTALKDLQSRFPKWKKEAPSATTLYVKYKGYYLEVKAVEWLFDLLGKEE